MPENKTWGNISLLVGHYYKLELKMSKLEAPKSANPTWHSRRQP